MENLSDGCQLFYQSARPHTSQIQRLVQPPIGQTLDDQRRATEILIAASPKPGDHVLGRFQAIDGRPWTWNNPGPYLLIRNAREAACYRVEEEE